jgi:hypothetical protein
MPYSREVSYVIGYAKQRKLPKKRIVALTPEAFDRLRSDADDNTDFQELFEYKFGKKIFYITESEFEFFDDVCSDLCFETSSQIMTLYQNLKYFESKETDNIRKAIKELLKAKDYSRSDLSMSLMSSLNIDKAANKVIIKQKGGL